MSHYRFCPLSGNCVIISKKRKRRPSDFAFDGFENENIESPFIYGNEHKTPDEIYAVRNDSSVPNTPGWQVRVVPNKYNALDIEKEPKKIRFGLYDTIDGCGAHEVIIDTPKFPSSIYDFSTPEIVVLLETIAVRIADLGRDLRLKYILPFKNNGPFSGATIAHPHTQIMALPFLPHTTETEMLRCKTYYAEHSRSLLEDLAQEELIVKSRIVFKSENFLAFCPFASSHPFAINIMPVSQKNDFLNLDTARRQELADLLRETITRLGHAIDKASFNIVFRLKPPVREDERDYNLYHLIDNYYGWRIELTPRLLLEGGFELGSSVHINSVPPEEAAEFLRNVKGRR